MKRNKLGQFFAKGNQAGHWKGGRAKTGRGYIKIYIPNHPNASKGYVFEHRFIMEKKLGRYLFSHEIVHHINHIKIDNRLENLILTTRKGHPKIHNWIQNRWSLKYEKCIDCGTTKIHHEVHGWCYKCYKKHLNISRRKKI